MRNAIDAAERSQFSGAINPRAGCLAHGATSSLSERTSGINRHKAGAEERAKKDSTKNRAPPELLLSESLLNQHQIGKSKAVAQDDFSARNRNCTREHRASVAERVKLATLATFVSKAAGEFGAC